MKKTILISMVAFLFIAISCKTIILKIAGFRVPKIENKQSIFSFLKKIGQDTNDVYAMDTTLMKNLRNQCFKPGMSKGFRPIQIRVYDSLGRPIMQWASCEGFLKTLKTFDSIPPKNHNSLNTTINLNEDLSRYYTLEGIQAKIIPPSNQNYYFIVYFGKYFPRLTKESFSQVEKYKKQNPTLKIKVYKINVDVQEFWGADLKNEMEIRSGG